MERSAELERFIRQMYELMKAGDHDTLNRFVPDEQGVVFVGTDAGEWWDSPAGIHAAFREQLVETGGFPIEESDPQGYLDGDIGWFSDRPSMRMGDDNVIPMRLTGVVRRVGDTWQLVQGHLSVAASLNDQLFE